MRYAKQNSQMHCVPIRMTSRSYYCLDDFTTYKVLYALHAYQDATPDVSVAHYCMPWSSVRMYALVIAMHQAKRMF